MNINIKGSLYKDKDSVFYINPNLLGIKWWEKLVLLFIKPKMSVDWGNEEELACAVFYKQFRNKVYIVGQKDLMNYRKEQ